MEAFLDKLEFHTRGKAVDAACGCVALSVDFWAHKYKSIYMFDRDFEAVDIAGVNMLDCKKEWETAVGDLNGFNPENVGKVNGFYMRWCLTYLSRQEQISFLQKAQATLDNGPGRYSRTNGPSSYIVILENVDCHPNRKNILEHKGHTIPNEDYFTKLFAEAGVEVHREAFKLLMKGYFAVKIWALY